MMDLVLDASVAVKWFLPPEREALVDEAQNVLDDYILGATNLLVPDLFWAEVGNVFWKAILQGRWTKETAEAAFTTLRERNLPTAPSLPFVDWAFTIATAWNRTMYDSIYVALAVHTGRQLLTADERLVNALAARFPVRWLGAM